MKHTIGEFADSVVDLFDDKRIALTTQLGPLRVRAKVFGFLGIHRVLNGKRGEVQISHVPSGLAIPTIFDCRSAAIIAVVEIVRRADKEGLVERLGFRRAEDCDRTAFRRFAKITENVFRELNPEAFVTSAPRACRARSAAR